METHYQDQIDANLSTHFIALHVTCLVRVSCISYGGTFSLNWYTLGWGVCNQAGAVLLLSPQLQTLHLCQLLPKGLEVLCCHYHGSTTGGQQLQQHSLQYLHELHVTFLHNVTSKQAQWFIGLFEHALVLQCLKLYNLDLWKENVIKALQNVLTSTSSTSLIDVQLMSCQ